MAEPHNWRPAKARHREPARRNQTRAAQGVRSGRDELSAARGAQLYSAPAYGTEEPPNRLPRKGTPERDQLAADIAERRARGESLLTVSVELNLSENSVRTICTEYAIPSPRPQKGGRRKT